MHKLYINRDAREGGEDPGVSSGRVRREEEGAWFGASRRWREVNVAFNIGELYASAGRRIRRGGKGDIARARARPRARGGRGSLVHRGGNGEIRCVRDTRLEGEWRGGFRAFVGRIDRATCMCYIPPGSSVRT